MLKFEKFLGKLFFYGDICLFGILLAIVIVYGLMLLVAGFIEILEVAFLTNI